MEDYGDTRQRVEREARRQAVRNANPTKKTRAQKFEDGPRLQQPFLRHHAEQSRPIESWIFKERCNAKARWCRRYRSIARMRRQSWANLV